MLKIERVLCPLDFSETSGLAYDYAQSVAGHFSSPLYLEHVVEPFSSVYNYYPLHESWDEVRTREAREHIQKFILSHKHGGRTPELAVQEGAVPESILKFAQAQKINLIVMGTHDHRGLDFGMLGSVTEKVMRKSPCPVMAVRSAAHMLPPKAIEQNDIRLQRIIFCTDFSETASRALNYALSLAMEFGAEITVLHVLESLPAGLEPREALEAAAREIREMIPGDASDWCSLRTAVRVGKPYQEIVQIALEAEADLVVMGVRRRSAIDLAMFGSTTHRVIQLGSCPVLAVHPN